MTSNPEEITPTRFRPSTGTRFTVPTEAAPTCTVGRKPNSYFGHLIVFILAYSVRAKIYEKLSN